jgi:poly(3-hydroxybutyrate) depolymerase
VVFRLSDRACCYRFPSSIRPLAYTNCAQNADVILYAIEGGGPHLARRRTQGGTVGGRTTIEIYATTIM